MTRGGGIEPLEALFSSELESLLRAGVPARAVRITVREIVVERFERAPVASRDVTDVVEAAVRAVCRLARERDASDEMVETVCRAALEAVRGHGGESARWLPDATFAASSVLDELADRLAGDLADARAGGPAEEQTEGPGGRAMDWHFLARHLEAWSVDRW